MTDTAELIRIVRQGLKYRIDGTTMDVYQAGRALSALDNEIRAFRKADESWLRWSDGRYPDDSPGDVIAAEFDGTITLDDGITTWNPLRALAFFHQQNERREGGEQ